MNPTLFTALSLGAMFSVAAPASAAEPLTGAQIQALLSGKTFDGYQPKNGIRARVYADPNGDWLYQPTSGKNAGKILKWSWLVRGDEHCGIQNGEERCGKLYPQADGSYQKVRDGTPGFVISNIVDGNQLP